MTLQEMQERKRTLGYSNARLAVISGVPLGTVQKIMSGKTENPRRKTLESLEKALSGEMKQETDDAFSTGEPSLLREAAAAYGTALRKYTIEDIYALPDGVRAELIDGRLYYMASPTRTHQKIAGEMYLAVANYIKAHGGRCEVYIPSFAVFLNADDTIYVEPDLSVICDPDKLDDRGCNGAPDWIVEVVSPSSQKMDYCIKLFKYRAAGVREYWIIDPQKRVVMVYLFGKGEEEGTMYSFEEEIPCSIYPDLKIKPASLLWEE